MIAHAVSRYRPAEWAESALGTAIPVGSAVAFRAKNPGSRNRWKKDVSSAGHGSNDGEGEEVRVLTDSRFESRFNCSGIPVETSLPAKVGATIASEPNRSMRKQEFLK